MGKSFDYEYPTKQQPEVVYGQPVGSAQGGRPQGNQYPPPPAYGYGQAGYGAPPPAGYPGANRPQYSNGYGAPPPGYYPPPSGQPVYYQQPQQNQNMSPGPDICAACLAAMCCCCLMDMMF